MTSWPKSLLTDTILLYNINGWRLTAGGISAVPEAKWDKNSLLNMVTGQASQWKRWAFSLTSKWKKLEKNDRHKLCAWDFLMIKKRREQIKRKRRKRKKRKRKQRAEGLESLDLGFILQHGIQRQLSTILQHEKDLWLLNESSLKSKHRKRTSALLVVNSLNLIKVKYNWEVRVLQSVITSD